MKRARSLDPHATLRVKNGIIERKRGKTSSLNWCRFYSVFYFHTSLLRHFLLLLLSSFYIQVQNVAVLHARCCVCDVYVYIRAGKLYITHIQVYTFPDSCVTRFENSTRARLWSSRFHFSQQKEGNIDTTHENQHGSFECRDWLILVRYFVVYNNCHPCWNYSATHAR